MKRFPISSNAIKWLETFVSHRFGIKLILSKDEDRMKMTLAGFEGAIVFNNLSPSLTESHSNQPHTVWNGSREGWYSILNDSFLQLSLKKVLYFQHTLEPKVQAELL